jgi:hypothetical protein
VATTDLHSRPPWAAFALRLIFVNRKEVFNISVEKSEEKPAAIVVTASQSYVSALCTARGAGGLVAGT